METIQDLLNFAESIPEDQYITRRLCTNPFIRKKQPGCIIGHLNYELGGSYTWPETGSEEEFPSIIFLKSIGITIEEIVDHNNGYKGDKTLGPKGRVVAFLKSKLEGQHEPEIHTL
jgi:hypothetical protein